MTSNAGLSQFQIEVAQVFFSLGASGGYLVTGGAGLIASHLISRPTQDLDIFAHKPTRDVADARRELLGAARSLGWEARVLVDTDTFCRIEDIGPDDAVMIDLAIDAPPSAPPTMTILGPTLASLDLAGRKLLALFSRAEARDFADVFLLARMFGKQELLCQAAIVNPGFDPIVLAEMFAAHARLADDEIPVPSPAVAELRDFFTAWSTELRQSG